MTKAILVLGILCLHSCSFKHQVGKVAGCGAERLCLPHPDAEVWFMYGKRRVPTYRDMEVLVEKAHRESLLCIKLSFPSDPELAARLEDAGVVSILPRLRLNKTAFMRDGQPYLGVSALNDTAYENSSQKDNTVEKGLKAGVLLWLSSGLIEQGDDLALEIRYTYILRNKKGKAVSLEFKKMNYKIPATSRGL